MRRWDRPSSGLVAVRAATSWTVSVLVLTQWLIAAAHVPGTGGAFVAVGSTVVLAGVCAALAIVVLRAGVQVQTPATCRDWIVATGLITRAEAPGRPGRPRPRAPGAGCAPGHRTTP